MSKKEDEGKKSQEVLLYLSEFLDAVSLTRAERLYYSKHFDDKTQKTADEWSKLTKLKTV